MAKLCAAVIAQAVKDATAKCVAVVPRMGARVLATPAERDTARAWLTGDSPDFHLICLKAGLDAGTVSAFANRLKQKDWQ